MIGERALPSRRQAAFTITVLFFTAALCTIDRFVLNLMVDPIRTDLAISETQMSLLQGLAFSLFYSLAGLPLGLLADRGSRRNLLLGGVALWSAATYWASEANSFEEMFAARVLVGAGEATLWPVAVSLIADVFEPRHRGKAISAIILGQIFGSSLALFAGGLLLTAAADGAFSGLAIIGDIAPWRAVLTICAGLGLFALLALLAVREPPRLHGVPTDRVPLLAPMLELMKRPDPTMLLLFVTAFLLSTAVYANAAWTAPFYIRHFDLEPGQAGPMLGGIGLAAGIAGALLAGLLTDRAERLGKRSSKATIAIIAIVGCIPAALIVLSPSLLMAYAGTAIGSVCFPLAGASVIILLQDLTPPHNRGLAMSINTLVGGLFGASLGPFLTAAATDYLYQDDNLVGWSLATINIPTLGAAALTMLVLRRRLLERT